MRQVLLTDAPAPLRPTALAARRDRRARGVALIIAVISITLLTVVATEFAYNTPGGPAAGRQPARRGAGLLHGALGRGAGPAAAALPEAGGPDAHPQPGGPSSEALAPAARRRGAAGGRRRRRAVAQHPALEAGACGLPHAQGAGEERAARARTARRRGRPEDDPNFEIQDDESDPGGADAMQPMQALLRRLRGLLPGHHQRRGGEAQRPPAGGPGHATRCPPRRACWTCSATSASSSSSTATTPTGARHPAGRRHRPARTGWTRTRCSPPSTPADPVNPVAPRASRTRAGNYDRFDPRYEAKNARFDSVDELYRVHGVTDMFMAAFRDRLTVYPDVNSPAQRQHG